MVHVRPLLAASAAGVLALGVVGLLAAFAPTSSAAATASLTDDSGGVALFPALTNLSPGVGATACITISTSGAVSGDRVLVAADNLTGDLADDLSVAIDAGSGGTYGDCTGFSGSRVYTGTLADLADLSDSTDGVTTGWQPAQTPARTFRFTVTMPAGTAVTAMGHHAQATFSWRLTSTPPASPTPTSTPSPTPSPSVTPTTSPTTTAPPTTTGPADPGSSGGGGENDGDGDSGGGNGGNDSGGGDSGSGDVPGSDPTTAPTTAPGIGGDGSPDASVAATPSTSATTAPAVIATGRSGGTGGTGADDGTPALTLRPEFVLRVGRTLQGIADKPQFLFGPVLVAMAFLLMQHLIDRRDPKLANASRTGRDLTLPFPRRYQRTEDL